MKPKIKSNLATLFLRCYRQNFNVLNKLSEKVEIMVN